MEYVVLHGVERIEPKWGYQDFWALKQDVFLPLLDGVKERSERGDLWVTDHVTCHQYAVERDAAAVTAAEAGAGRLAIDLVCRADPAFYDCPLTLATRLPADWPGATARQGGKVLTLRIVAGEARYRADPHGGRIELERSAP